MMASKLLFHASDLIYRRVRNTSGAGSLSTETPSESNEENSNSAPPQAASCPVTPAVQLESTTAPPSFLLRKTKRVSSTANELVILVFVCCFFKVFFYSLNNIFIFAKKVTWAPCLCLP
jgi:hypothetical protein